MTEVDRTGDKMFRRAVVDLQLDRCGGRMSIVRVTVRE